MPQHTPGPWTIQKWSGNVASPSGHVIASIPQRHGGRIPIEEREPNARLISSAPDLLAALKALSTEAYMATAYMTTHKRDLMESVEAAHAAILKAEGAQ
jgi:hypothetical protein